VRDLILQERFEIEVLDRLNSGRFLRFLYFGGGTMLRLCHGLDRYSVDLDFWIVDPLQAETLFNRLEKYLARFYMLKDAAAKHFSLLFELKTAGYPRRLKIEIRTEDRKPETEQAIAYSPHADRQVLLYAMTLQQMMRLKTAALLDRKEIRDAYDLEFMVKRGVQPIGAKGALEDILGIIDAFKKTDYTNKLGSLIEPAKRPYYRDQNFRILKAAVKDRLLERQRDDPIP
jgi:predicted nucleotidyltransferase component of viral defense system